MRTICLTFILVVFQGMFAFGFTTPPDSIGIRKVNNQHFIVHKVDRGETLTSIATRYQVPISSLQKANIATENIKVGQILLVPYLPSKRPTAIQIIQKYEVQRGDNLYKIARQFDMDVDRLMAINQLKDNNLELGQILKVEVKSPIGPPVTSAETNDRGRVGQPFATKRSPILHKVKSGDTMYGISQRYNIPIDSINHWNQLADKKPLYVGQELIVGHEKPTQASILDVPEMELPHNTSESGVGAMIRDKGQGSMVEVCLHPDAKYGTLIKVTNPSNNRSVVVKVIGKLSDVDQKKNIIARISEPACQKIGILNDQFPVLLEYNK